MTRPITTLEIGKIEGTRLTVTRLFRKDGATMADCVCECHTMFTTWAKAIKRGLTKSCGCYRDELGRESVRLGIFRRKKK